MSGYQDHKICPHCGRNDLDPLAACTCPGANKPRATADHSQRIQDIKIRDALCKMYDALKAADVEYSALSTNGINIFAADRKSIDACVAALDRAAQWDGLCRNLRHWQEECGKIHSQLDASLSRELALREALKQVTATLALITKDSELVDLARAAISKATTQEGDIS